MFFFRKLRRGSSLAEISEDDKSTLIHPMGIYDQNSYIQNNIWEKECCCESGMFEMFKTLWRYGIFGNIIADYFRIHSSRIGIPSVAILHKNRTNISVTMHKGKLALSDHFPIAVRF